ncbi:hypothetical protein FE257_004211 [Aspergillus nanangensis]|uniref:pectinesterase n=1 Tax=Aspergillus nanangensis TaxID=2582783 RepID=A0AAD4GW62_ASPNN|nr:hypothetical protein FE257_004211 [Aspergillus nanangensis]
MRFVPTILALTATASALSIQKRESRTSPPEGCLAVGSDGDYSTVGDALDALDSGAACIYIAAGTYNEQLTVTYTDGLTIYGETTDTTGYGQNTVTITNTLSSPDAGSLVDSATINIDASSVSMYNINVENGYGEGAQAVAVAVSGDQNAFYGCQFLGYQDTLYAREGTQYYSKCYMEGATDYIFGDASAWYGECDIVSVGAGYITAMSRETDDDPSWYAFDHCTIQGGEGLDLSEAVYLGRPWRVFARVIYQNCELSDIINPKGWTEMADNATPLYYEIDNTGDGADTSEREYLSEIDAAVTQDTVLGSDWASWVDQDF